jgi:prevent-host-death family protein
MTHVSLAEAKARLSDLITQAAVGETICITRHGRPVAQLTAADGAKLPVDVAALRALTGAQAEAAPESIVRTMRDADRY